MDIGKVTRNFRLSVVRDTTTPDPMGYGVPFHWADLRGGYGSRKCPMGTENAGHHFRNALSELVGKLPRKHRDHIAGLDGDGIGTLVYIARECPAKFRRAFPVCIPADWRRDTLWVGDVPQDNTYSIAFMDKSKEMAMFGDNIVFAPQSRMASKAYMERLALMQMGIKDIMAEYVAWAEGDCLYYSLEEQGIGGEWEEVDSCGGFVVVGGDVTYAANEVLCGLTATPEAHAAVQDTLGRFYARPVFVFTAQRAALPRDQLGMGGAE